jgi:hypothetical protein
VTNEAPVGPIESKFQKTVVRTPLDLLTTATLALFVIAGGVWVVSQIFLAFQIFKEQTFFEQGGDEWVSTAASISYTLWQFSVGTLILIVALQVRLYIRDKAESGSSLPPR